MQIILSSSYNAPISYFSKLLMGYDVMIDEKENYQKQSYRNRCNIYAADGIKSLIVPVKFQNTAKTSVDKTPISYESNWQHLHWNAIISAYNSTPFFEYYEDDFKKIYNHKFEYISDLNNALLSKTIELLKIEKYKPQFSNAYIEANRHDQYDFRDIISPKSKIKDNYFQSENYYQVFAQNHGFKENLSILDLLFNMGNESILILMKSIKKQIN